ncbi:MFS transporter [Duffyella gerundensis]|uniref:MFS transporter n=2 Tax=Duffyella gerundensis TaxID=1619313 RepID=UPI0021F7042D|nr:MFS transporter [Duffyella gerundensis]
MNNMPLPPENRAVIYTMLLGTFLSRAGYFMTWPYLSLVLYRDFGLSASLIGAIFFMTSASGILFGMLGSYYSDIIGRERALIISLVLSVAGFSVMAGTTEVIGFVIAMALISLGRACTESFSKAMIGDYVNDVRQREKFQYIRYYIVNIGTAFGPVAGTYALTSPSLNIFIISAIIYIIYTILMITIVAISSKSRREKASPSAGILHAFSIILSQPSFVRLLISYSLLMFVYISFDSPLIQFLTRISFPDLTFIISAIFFTNAITVITCQYPVLYLLRSSTVNTKISLGIILISLAQLFFMLAYFKLIAFIIFATFLLSLGELIAMPAFSIEVDRLAPANLRGTSFGIINLTSLGASLCPLVCGLLIDAGYGYAMFFLLFLTGLLSILIYKKVGLSRKVAQA